MRDLFRQMQRAKRSAPPDPTELHTDDVLICPDGRGGCRAISRVQGTRRRYRSRVAAHVFARHCCSFFHRVGADIFVCERTGRAHVCDEGVPRESRGHGRHVGDVFHQRAVVRSHSRRGRGGDDGRRNTRGGRRGSTGERGWLGKCFEAGYGASSERDMYYALWGGVRSRLGGERYV